MKKGIADNIVPEDSIAYVEGMIAERLDYVREQLPITYYMAEKIGEFSAKLYEMGDDGYGRKAMSVREYIPASILPLADPAL